MPALQFSVVTSVTEVLAAWWVYCFMYTLYTLHHSVSSAHVVVDNTIPALCCACTCTFIRMCIHAGLSDCFSVHSVLCVCPCRLVWMVVDLMCSVWVVWIRPKWATWLYFCLCLSLQVCQSDGGQGWWGIGSVTSAQMADVTTSIWVDIHNVIYTLMHKKTRHHMWPTDLLPVVEHSLVSSMKALLTLMWVAVPSLKCTYVWPMWVVAFPFLSMHLYMQETITVL